MICPNCENNISFNKVRCSICKTDLSTTKRIIKLSNTYYNHGLEKAKIRDLSGAITLLNNSLKLNKRNTDARNLLGLIYFEIGEVVKALSEWVISKHFQADNNDADYYLQEIQDNPTKLDKYSNIIKRYNQALIAAKQGNDDMSIIQLKKIISINPTYIAALQLIALQYIRNKEYNRAKRYLNQAKQIDITNTKTLRYLNEIRLRQSKTYEASSQHQEEKDVEVSIVPISSYKEDKPNVLAFVNLLIGVIVGIITMYILVIPTIKREYDISLNSKYAEYNKVISQQEDQDDIIRQLREEKEILQAEKDKLKKDIDSIVIPDFKDNLQVYDSLFEVIDDYMQEEEAGTNKILLIADKLLNMDEDLLETNKAKQIFQKLKDSTYIDASKVYSVDGYKLYEAKKYEEAIVILEKSYLLDNENLDAIYFLARSHHFSGDKDNARLYYEILINDHEGSRRANQAKDKIRGL